jgi:hypothetical protein
MTDTTPDSTTIWFITAWTPAGGAIVATLGIGMLHARRHRHRAGDRPARTGRRRRRQAIEDDDVEVEVGVEQATRRSSTQPGTPKPSPSVSSDSARNVSRWCWTLG